MKVDITKDAMDFLFNLQPKQCKQVARKALSLCINPQPHDHIKMKGGLYRVDEGEFRIVYDIDRDTVRIMVIGKRNDDEAYKKANRIK